MWQVLWSELWAMGLRDEQQEVWFSRIIKQHSLALGSNFRLLNLGGFYFYFFVSIVPVSSSLSSKYLLWTVTSDAASTVFSGSGQMIHSIPCYPWNCLVYEVIFLDTMSAMWILLHPCRLLTTLLPAQATCTSVFWDRNHLTYCIRWREYVT